MSVITYTKTGAKATASIKLDPSIFEINVPNHELVKQAYVAYLANGRQNLAVTKTRGLVRGGGKKPWKQKGTGRARFGSSRVPIWRGGGITFGPTGNENYSQKITVKAKRLAIRQALSMSVQENRLAIIDSFDNSQNKTNEIASLLKKFGVRRRTLIIVEEKTPELLRVIANISDVKVVQARYINVYDVVNAHHILITKKSLPIISEWLGNSTTKEVASEKIQGETK